MARLAQGNQVVAGHGVVLAAVHHDQQPPPCGRPDLDLAALRMQLGSLCRRLLTSDDISKQSKHQRPALLTCLASSRILRSECRIQDAAAAMPQSRTTDSELWKINMQHMCCPDSSLVTAANFY
jgi:hypothetical protein